MTAPADRQAAEEWTTNKSTPDCTTDFCEMLIAAHLAGQAHGRKAAWGGKCPKHGQYVGVCTCCVEAQAARDGRAAGVLEGMENGLHEIPANWLDPMLTGPDAIAGLEKVDCRVVERLFNRLRERIEAELARLRKEAK